MTSCLFPTGFASAFAIFSFLFALGCVVGHPAVLRNSILREQIASFVGFALFGWLSLSALWSDTSPSETFQYLMEYRHFLIIPIIVRAAALVPDSVELAVKAMVFGAVIALASSYYLWFQSTGVEGEPLSLANRIYHGLLISILMLFSVSALSWTNLTRFQKAFWLSLATLSGMNVLFIEEGRTGQIQVIVVFLWASVGAYISSRRKLVFVSVFCGVVLSCFVVFFETRLLQTFIDLLSLLEEGSAVALDPRLVYYQAALSLWGDNFWIGLGVGDVEASFRALFLAGEMPLLTDNVHSEFLNFSLMGGVIGLILLCSYLFLLADIGRGRTSSYSVFRIGFFLVFALGMVFNSYFKDFGEKNLFIIMVVILQAENLRRARFNEK